MHSSIAYEVPTKENKAELLDFILDYFITSEPHLVYSKLDRNEMKAIYQHTVDDVCSENSVSYAAIDKSSPRNEIVGICINGMKDPSDKMQYDVDKYSKNFQPFIVFINLLFLNWAQTVSDCRRLFLIRILCVRPDYQRRGIAKTLCKFSLEKAIQCNCNYAGAAAVALESQKLLGSMGFSKLKVIKHEDYKDENGKVVFPNFGELTEVQWIVKSLE